MKAFITTVLLECFIFIVSAMAEPPLSVSAEKLKKGANVYKTNCEICHGEKGDGNGVAGASLNPKPRNFSKDKFKRGDSLESVMKTVEEGLPGTSMAGFNTLSKEDREAVSLYVLSSFRKKGEK